MNFELCLKGLSLECPTKPSSKAPCKRTQHCWMSHVKSVCTPCCMLMQVVGSCCEKVETDQTLSQQLPTFVLFSDRRSVAQQSWIQLHSSSNIVGERQVLYTRSPWSSLTFMGCVLPNVVGSCCIRLHTTTKTDATTPNMVGR